LLADLSAGADRQGLVKDADMRWHGRSDASESYTLALLGFEDGGPEPEPPDFYALEVLGDPLDVLARRPLGLELNLPWQNADGLLVRALFESFLGNHALAAKALREMLRQTGVGGVWGADEPLTPGNLFAYRMAGSSEQRRGFRRAFFLAAVLAARADEADNARRYLDLAPEETHGRAMLLPVLDAMDRGTPNATAWLQHEASWQPDKELWASVRRGDARELVEQLVAQQSTGLGVLPFAPRLVRRSPLLAAWAAQHPASVCWGCSVLEQVRVLAAHRRVAQAVGNGDLEADLAARLDRARTALLRRDIAVALHVLDRIGGR
jgi:hypothetical protein